MDPIAKMQQEVRKLTAKLNKERTRRRQLENKINDLHAQRERLVQSKHDVKDIKQQSQASALHDGLIWDGRAFDEHENLLFETSKYLQKLYDAVDDLHDYVCREINRLESEQHNTILSIDITSRMISNLETLIRTTFE